MVDLSTTPLLNPDAIQVREAALWYGLLVILALFIYSYLRKMYQPSITPRNTDSLNIHSTGCHWPHFDFSWPWKAMALRESDLIRICSFDGYIFIRVIRLMSYLTAFYTIVGIFVMVPFYRNQVQDVKCINVCAGREKAVPDPFVLKCVCGLIDTSSMAASQGVALWMPVGIMIIFAVVTLFACGLEYQEMLRIRKDFWNTRPPQGYTVLVEYIPNKLRSASGEKLKEYFEQVFPGELLDVSMVDVDSAQIQDIEYLANIRHRVLASLERAVTLKEQGVSRICGIEQDMDSNIKSMEADLELLNEKFCSERDQYMQATQVEEQEIEASTQAQERLGFNRVIGYEYFSCAFVTFKSLCSSAIASQNTVEQVATGMNFKPAPEPRDVVWENIGMSHTSRMVRRSLTRALFVLILLFWGVLTSVIGASTSTESLAEQFPKIRDILVVHPYLQRYLDYVAPIVLLSVVGIVNPIVTFTCRLEGRNSDSEADWRATERYFVFLIIQVFLFYSIAGTLFKTLVQIIQQPAMIVSTLGANIPKNAAFYIQFIMVKIFWMLCFELLRVVDVFLSIFRRIIFGSAITYREKISYFWGCFDLHYPSPVNLSSTLSQLLLVYFICIVYAVIQPLVLPASFLFFAFANVVYTVVLTTARKQMYGSGGRFLWNVSFKCIVFGLITAELTLLGVLILKQGFSQVFVMWILLVVTIYTSLKVYRRYSPLIDLLPLNFASNIDKSGKSHQFERVQPTVWQYGALRPGYQNTFRDDVIITYSFKKPILSEAPVAIPFKFNLDTESTRYGTTS